MDKTDNMLNWQENVLLSPLTTIGLGGEARFFSECKNEKQLQETVAYCQSRKIDFYVLGGGSNTIFPDQGFDGLVLKLGISFVEDRGDSLVQVGAGNKWDDFVVWAGEKGYFGVEAMSGIPGSVGGTPIQNVGAYGQEVCEVIASVRVLEVATGKYLDIANEHCDFSYRASRFKFRDQGKFIVTAVTFDFSKKNAVHLAYAELKNKVELRYPDFDHLSGQIKLGIVRDVVLELRRGKAMVYDPKDKNSKSLGSFFTNPILNEQQFKAFWSGLSEDLKSKCPHFQVDKGVKLSAAWLVEKAGFVKGTVRGGVGTSQKHSLALINIDGSTTDLLEFASEITSEVKKRFGVALVREPVLVKGSNHAN